MDQLYLHRLQRGLGGAQGPNRGSANVYLDGVFFKTVSLYASTYSAKPIVYAASAGHPRIDLDAFVRVVGL